MKLLKMGKIVADAVFTTASGVTVVNVLRDRQEAARKSAVVARNSAAISAAFGVAELAADIATWSKNTSSVVEEEVEEEEVNEEVEEDE